MYDLRGVLQETLQELKEKVASLSLEQTFIVYLLCARQCTKFFHILTYAYFNFTTLQGIILVKTLGISMKKLQLDVA